MDRRTINRRTMLKATGGAAALAATARLSPAVFAQSATPTAGAGAAAGTLIIGKGQEAVGLDPAKTTAASSQDLQAVVYDRLVVFDDNNKPQPELAEKWENPDETTFVFHLRPNAAFQDGAPLTSADVKASFDRIIDPATASPWASQFAPVASIEATDPQTVTFKLKQAYGPFLATLSAVYSSIVPKAALDKGTDLQSTMIGTNAFGLKEYKKDVETILDAFPRYWQEGLPKLATLDYKILPDEPSRLSAIRAGDIALTTLADPANVDTAKSADGVKVIDQETTDYYLMGLNCKQAPFDNVKVRQAMSYAIDRQAIVEAVFFGQGKVTGPIVPTLGDWAVPVDQLDSYKPDPDKAKSLLSEAGVSNLSFKILVGSLYPEFVSIALVIQDQLKQIGVKVDLDQVEWGTFIDRWKKRDFQAFVSYNGSGNDPDRALYPALHTGGSVNAFQFSDPKVDSLLDEARNTNDAAERKKLYNEIEPMVVDEAPAIFICTRTAHFALRDTVSGFAPSPSQTWDTLKETTVSGS
jgi:peptide/nickel transport system substrate-binding protein